MIVVAFVLVATFIETAHTGDASRCAEAADHVTQRECLEQVFKQADADLYQAEKMLRLALTTWKEEKSFKLRTLARFDKAVKSFRLYRHDACEFDASAAAGGNGAGDLRLDCAIRLTNERLEILKDQNNWFSE